MGPLFSELLASVRNGVANLPTSPALFLGPALTLWYSWTSLKNGVFPHRLLSKEPYRIASRQTGNWCVEEERGCCRAPASRAAGGLTCRAFARRKPCGFNPCKACYGFSACLLCPRKVG